MSIFSNAWNWLTGMVSAPPMQIGSMTEFEKWMDSLGAENTKSGVQVTSDTAMRVATVHACIKVLSEAIGTLPIKVYQKVGDDEREERPNHWLQKLLNRPAPELTAIQLKEFIVAMCNLCGFAPVQKVYNGNGKVMKLVPLEPAKLQSISTVDSQTGKKLKGYVYKLDIGKEVILAFDEVWITEAFLGLSPISLAKEQVGLASALEEHGARLFSNGARPGGVLEHPGKLGEEATKKLKASWYQKHGGVSNSHRVAVLEEGMVWKAMSMSSEDAQYIESRRFSKEELASIFRVAMHFINDLSRATFSNIEHQGIEFVQYSLQPWMIRIEQSIERDLLSPEEIADGYYVRVNANALLRGDFKTRVDGYAVAIQNGIMTQNECRKLENLSPKDGGDELLRPLNMTTSNDEGGETNGQETEQETA